MIKVWVDVLVTQFIVQHSFEIIIKITRVQFDFIDGKHVDFLMSVSNIENNLILFC